MKRGDLLFWIWLSEALGAANKSFRALISSYENPYDCFHADETEIEHLPDLSDRTRASLLNKDLTRATEILEACEKTGTGVLPFGDERYPTALREIKNPPVLLYWRGKLPDWNRRLCVGMVGTRRMSAYGLRSAYKISYELASAGAIVVSGMAAGIDGVSAAAAIAAKAPTVAVLGCGPDIVYPKHHRELMEEIIRSGGTVLSEYPPGTAPASYHFPVRNRIISGISQGTLVVEAGIGSGSLITAKEAILQGRDVFALPANVGSAGAEGTNGLLRDGANIVTGTEDILKPYHYVFAETLDEEKLAAARTRSDADPAYLERLGIIERTETSDGKKSQTPRKSEPVPVPAHAGSGKRQTAEPPEKMNAGRQTAGRTMRKRSIAESPPETEGKTPDSILSSLSPIQRAVLEMIPDDRAVSADTLTALEYPYGESVAALTMLEIMGLVQKLPGGLYTRS